MNRGDPRAFAVYQQLQPEPTKQRDERGSLIYCPNVVCVGVVIARSGVDAIGLARTWPRFQIASRLAKHPMVQDTVFAPLEPDEEPIE